MSPRRTTVLVGALLAAAAVEAGGCTRVAATAPARGAGLQGLPIVVRDDPTVHGMRLVPEDLHDAHTWGPEPGGGVRASVAGVRILFSGHALLTAPDRLPSTPSAALAVPDRMGGGFLYVLGSQVWRSDTWLGPARPLVRSQAAVGDVFFGLDRAYLLFPPGTLAAFDPRTGAAEDVGPLPASPRMGRLSALDAWRAVAVVDFRGALVTLDAGASWRPLDLGGEPVDVSTTSGAIVVHALDPNRNAQWWEVERDGQALRLSAAPAEPPGVAVTDAASARLAGVLGPNPLAAAIEDGWPLGDGSALVARDGTLARVRLDDGTVADTAADAFPLRTARCHPASLAVSTDPGAFGFVCGEPRGKTALYRWNRGRAALTLIRQFDEPRQILAFGNGALAARGLCASGGAGNADGVTSGTDEERAWCAMTPGGAWSERHFRGDRADRARIVVLADGRVALVRPPDEELASGRLTLADGETATHLSLKFPLLRDDVTKALLRGVWLDGFEERRPGVLGGWVDAAGALVGLEIALDGTVRVGEYIHDAGAPVASGRWAFGWTASRRAFESIDGGMTWTKGIEVPDPVALPGATHERACGPIGCIAAGWLKVGWTGALPSEPAPASPATLLGRATRTALPLRFECERVSSESFGAAATASGARPGFGQPTLLAPGAPLPAFCGKPAPLRPSDASAVVLEIADAMGGQRRTSPVGMVYGWGPPAGDWDKVGRWEVRWRSRFGGCGSASGPAPWASGDAAGRALARIGGSAPPYVLAAADDGSRALLVTRRAAGFDLVALDAGRPPRDVHRTDGDVFPDIEAAIQAGPYFYVASAPTASQPAATVVWQIEGDIAREVGRTPRAGPEGRANVRLARRFEGRAVGVAVEGQPDATRPPHLWVVGIDPETGEVREPEPLGATDLGGHPLTPCTGDDDGWEVELPYPGSVDLDLGPGATWQVQSPVLAVRLSRTSSCVDRIAGLGVDDEKSPGIAGSPTGRLSGGRSVEVSTTSTRTRTGFRCRVP